jgi:deoxyribonuclease (pyrimidine dimer)
MVRINLIKPKQLADQHLIAEYNEILMLLGYVRKYPSMDSIPEKYCLGKGHIKFFKNKLIYLKKRHEEIKKEMKKRGFATNKTITLEEFNKELKKDWKARKKDKYRILALILIFQLIFSLLYPYLFSLLSNLSLILY